jgi:integrase
LYTINRLREDFLAEAGMLVRSGELKDVTLRGYEYQLGKLDPFGEFPADTLRVHHLHTIPWTNGFVRILKQLYKWATDNRIIPVDPFEKTKIPPCGRRERVLTRGELARLYRAAPRALRVLLFVQLRTLARPGEIRNLTWGQIDWERRVIVLTEFKAKAKRRDKLKARCIPLHKTVLRLLRNLHRKSPDPSDGGRVFYNQRFHMPVSRRRKALVTERCGPWSANGVRCAMRRARVAAGLMDGGERVVCYTLRHTGATQMCRRKIDLKHIAEVMGHARTTTTERYTHLDTKDMVATIDELFARPRTKTG